jgi:GAF domain-containing protein
MDKNAFVQRLEELKTKQKKIDLAWNNTGNRPLVEYFVEIIPLALDAERCSIFILDPKEENIWLHCGTGMHEKQITVPAWSSMVGKVIESGEYEVEMDMENTVGAHDGIDVKTGFVTRNALCVPIHGVSIDEVTGVIQVLNKKAETPYTEGDRDILEGLAFQIQINVENLYLRQEMSKVSTMMSEKIKILEDRLFKTG